ncbi:hypothetical protein HDU76_004472 [Blyttiomyces sp. JEL0837]|nr:hypothetical protein HDU76_004472 [Blyttiomyces sp. JEL0837]
MAASTVSENERLLAEVHGIEQRIVVLLQVASNAIESLADVGPDLDASQERFTEYHGEYMKLLNEIQIGLRKIFRHLAKSGILTASSSTISSSAGTISAFRPLPYRGSAEGEEKDFELMAGAVEMIKELVKDGVVRFCGDDSGDGRTSS